MRISTTYTRHSVYLSGHAIHPRSSPTWAPSGLALHRAGACRGPPGVPPSPCIGGRRTVSANHGTVRSRVPRRRAKARKEFGGWGPSQRVPWPIQLQIFFLYLSRFKASSQWRRAILYLYILWSGGKFYSSIFSARILF